ncbi:hypothetical protein [Cellulomonas sp.]|uniref:hypothetical protein n=1 Tax=Cellulomonas sp. TaxID=40001 RepID=UPI003BAA0268
MSGEPSDRPRQTSVLVLVVTLVAMMAAGLVFALDWVVEWPTGVLVGAVAIAVAGLVVFFVAGVRQARGSGLGVFRAVGRAVRGTIRAAFELFF